MRWIFDVPRNVAFGAADGSHVGPYDPYPAQRTLEYALQGQESGVVALGLGGYEVGAPPAPFAPAFAAAKAAGLASIPHAGETEGAASVFDAVHLLAADRIGHGVRAMEDPALLTVLRDRQIPLEINPTSNICLHVYRRMAEHPLPHLDRMGLKLTINSDDPPLFNTTLCDEYRLLASEFGYGRQDIARLARNAFEVSRAEPELKKRLLAEFDAWCASGLAADLDNGLSG
jgi:aminodeoxyfutalosine deaminase